MRKRMCVGALALSFLVSLAAMPASAKSVDSMRAQVPFAFHVGDKLVGAGAYTVNSMTDDEKLIRISSGKEVASVITNTGRDGGKGAGHARLVFHKYGDQYFLVAVWGADNNGRLLQESKRERGLRTETLIARGGAAAEPEVLTIDAR